MHASMTLRDRVEMLQAGMQASHEIIRDLHAKAVEDKRRIAELEAQAPAHYRDLLTRYMRTLLDDQGTAFLPAPGNRTSGGAQTAHFSPDEVHELEQIEGAALALDVSSQAPGMMRITRRLIGWNGTEPIYETTTRPA